MRTSPPVAAISSSSRREPGWPWAGSWWGEFTGLRNSCSQLAGLQPGLIAASWDRDASGNLIRKTALMAIVVEAGEVRGGDPIRALLPDGLPQLLEAL